MILDNAKVENNTYDAKVENNTDDMICLANLLKQLKVEPF